jgi:hypothetical protein
MSAGIKKKKTELIQQEIEPLLNPQESFVFLEKKVEEIKQLLPQYLVIKAEYSKLKDAWTGLKVQSKRKIKEEGRFTFFLDFAAFLESLRIFFELYSETLKFDPYYVSCINDLESEKERHLDKTRLLLFMEKFVVKHKDFKGFVEKKVVSFEEVIKAIPDKIQIEGCSRSVDVLKRNFECTAKNFISLLEHDLSFSNLDNLIANEINQIL